MRVHLDENSGIGGQQRKPGQEAGAQTGSHKCDDAWRPMMCLLEGKDMVALPCAAFDLSGVVRRLQIVRDGDDRQENCGQRSERDELQRHCGKN